MADKVIQVTVTANKKQSVSIAPGQVQNEITATPDSSAYYSNLSKNWAIGEGLILNEDYSSKYYATKAKDSENSAKNYANVAETAYNTIQDSASSVINEIENVKAEAVESVTDAANTGVASVENKTSEGVANIDAKTTVCVELVNATKTNAVNAVNTSKSEALTAINNTGINSKVSKSGDTMTGNLTIDNASQAIIHIDSDLAGLGSSPSGGKNTGSIYFKQKGVLTAIIQNMAAADGGNRLQLITRKPDNSAWGAGVNLITSKTGAATFDFPKCTTKATTTSTASAGNVAVIVQNYVNGTSWYRVWSDGWIEQGGRTGSSAGGTARTVTLLKSFSNTNYYVGLTSYTGGSSTVQFNNFQCTNKTTSNFTAKAGCNESLVLEWYACGY